MTTGPAGKHSTSGACSARSRTAANPLPSRSASDGWSSGPTPGSTTSADSVAAPNAARPASTATSPWPPPSSPSVHCGGPHGSSTAGTPGQDQHASADLLAAALSRGREVGAHRGEVLRASEGAQTAGHLLLDLGHPDVAFGRVVVERHPGVGGKAQ